MKKQMVRVVCLCLAFVVTLGSVGMAATEQICIMAGMQQKPTPATNHTCCAKPKNNKLVAQKTKLSKKCCITAKQYHKLQTPASEKPSSLKFPVLLPMSREVAFLWQEKLPKDIVPLPDNNKSPPLFGTALLKSLHQFQV